MATSILNTTCFAFSDTIDLTNTETPMDLQHNPQEQLMVNLLWSTMLTFGFISNVSFLFVVAKVPFMHTITNVYLGNLAVADLLYLLSSIGDELLRYNWSLLPGDDTHKGLLGCVIIGGIGVLCYLESALLISLVSLERYLAICFPLKHRFVNGPRRTVKLVLISWLFSFFLMMTYLLLYSGSITTYCVIWPDEPRYLDYPSTVNFCAAHDSLSHIAQMAFFVFWNVMWLVVMVFNIFMYVGIMKRLKQREKGEVFRDSHDSAQRNAAKNVRNQVGIMLVVNGSVFFSSWGFNAIRIVTAVLYHSGGTPLISPKANFILDLTCKVVFALNASVNPLVYNVTNSRYREAFRRTFILKRLNKPKVETVTFALE